MKQTRFSKARAKELFCKQLKHCSGCHVIKSHDQYHNNCKTWDKLKAVCKKCSKVESKKVVERLHRNPKKVEAYRLKALLKHRNTPGPRLWSNSKKRAELSGLEHTITKDHVIVPEFCPVLGIKLEVGRDRVTPGSPSLDRIDNSEGYTPDNIAVISWRANSLKKDATIDELERVLKWMKKQLRLKKNSPIKKL